MKNAKYYLLTCLLLTTFLMGSRLHADVGAPATGLLVKWKHGPASAAAAAGNAQIGGTVKRNFHALGWQLVELPPGMSVSDGLKAYRALDSVVAVEPDHDFQAIPPPPNLGTNPTINESALVQPAAFQPGSLPNFVPNDPRFTSQWNLRLLDLTNAWAVSKGSPDIVVAILDTGIDYTHEDLRDNMWRNPGETGVDPQGRDKATNGVDDDDNGHIDDVYGIDVVDNDSDPMDLGDSPAFYHGTACAGIIGAAGNNGVGMTGINWSVKLMALRVGDINGNIRIAYELAGFDYLLMMKQRGVNIRVSNHSYGGFTGFSRARYDGLASLHAAGILTVHSAGNESLDEGQISQMPAAFDLPLLTVAATDSGDALASYSNFGHSSVDLAAPGNEPLTTQPGNRYVTSGVVGTSFSAPHVAGAAALLAAVKPEATAWEIRAALMQSVDRKNSLTNRVVTHGRLNVGRAVQVLTNTELPPIVVSVTPSTSRTRANQKVEAWFSQPMDRASVESAFEISPAQAGTFQWADDSTRFQFVTEAPLVWTNHTVRIRATATSATGVLLDGNFDRVAQGTAADDYVWIFRFAPRNDDLANAEIISNDTGSLAANNYNASWEVDSPTERFIAGVHTPGWHHHSTLWYRWTAPQDGWCSFETSGTSLDTVLIAYAGGVPEPLPDVAGNNNDGVRLTSRISFGATAGSNYFLVVSGNHESSIPGSMGTFTLRWYPTPAPTFASAPFSTTSAYPGQKVTFSGTNFSGATRVLINGVPASFAFGTNANFSDLQLITTVPDHATTGPITIETPHGNVTTTSNFTVLLQPTLAIRPLPALNLVELSWLSTPGFTAQRTDALGPASQWVSVQFVSAWLTNNNTIRVVTVTNASPNRFFRLRRQ